MAQTTTVSSKGWVVIPKKLREAYNLTPGAKVQIVDYGESLRIIPVPEDPIEAAFGMLKEYPERYSGRSLTQELIDEHRREVEQEEAKYARETLRA